MTLAWLPARSIVATLVVGLALMHTVGTLATAPQRTHDTSVSSKRSREAVVSPHQDHEPTLASLQEDHEHRRLMRRAKDDARPQVEGEHAADSQTERKETYWEPSRQSVEKGLPRTEDVPPSGFLTMAEVRARDPLKQCETSCKDCSGAVYNEPDNFNHSDGVWCFCLPWTEMNALTKAAGTWPGYNVGCTSGCSENVNWTDAVCSVSSGLNCTCDVNVNYATGQAGTN